MAAGEQLNFYAWKRPALVEQAERVPGQPRLSGTLKLTLSDPGHGNPVEGEAPYTLMAAADVTGLQAGAILRTTPPPLARDVEVTKMVHVDFAEEDLPWRYTAEKSDNITVRPWLVLLVGTSEEMVVEGSVLNVKDSVLQDYDLAAAAALPPAKAGVYRSYLWAHVQETSGVRHARLVSPRKLEPLRKYVAAIVPAFNADGKEMWTLNNELVQRNFQVLPAFYSWSFWTAEGGDFETLAAKLHIPPAGSAGKTRLHYPRPLDNDGAQVKPKFQVGGAIMSLQPDLGLVKPDMMNDEQLLDGLSALMNDEQLRDQLLALLPEGVTKLTELTLAQKQQIMAALAQPVQDLIAAANADLDVLNNQLADPFQPPRQIIPMPPYGRPWLPDPDSIVSGWPDRLNDDPRFRGIAGLGTWMGVEGQEALMDAAVQQAGALRDAAQRVSYLALGLWAAGRLWDRRLPEAKNEQLRIFGPILARMMTTGGDTVLRRITSGTSPLTPAFFSGTAKRLLRDRATHTRHIGEVGGGAGGVDRSQALDIANEVQPLPLRAPAGLPHMDTIGESEGLRTIEEELGLDEGALQEIRSKLAELVQAVVDEYRLQGEAMRRDLAERLFDNYVSMLQDLLASFGLPCEGKQLAARMVQDLRLPSSAFEPWERAFITFLEEVLVSAAARRRLEEALLLGVRRCMFQQRCLEYQQHLDVAQPAAFCDDVLANLPPAPRQEQTPIDLGRLHQVIADALNPHLPGAPARVRVGATIHGLDLARLVRPEFPIGLNFPTWGLLRQYDKEWLLPGVNALEKDSITALQTNPAFIDAFMVGINSQFIAEMVWRDLPVARDCTPLRMFWGAVDYKNGKRQADIEPLREWAKAPEKDVGDLAHQTVQPSDPQNASGNRLVIVFRSDLFRRYPGTLVYLFKPQPGDVLDDWLKATPDLGEVEAAKPTGERRFFGPTFVGVLTPEVTFFAFDVRPETLDKYWLMLGEPPAELRFRSDKTPAQVTVTHSATFAATTIDEPTRVAISGAWLEEQAKR